MRCSGFVDQNGYEYRFPHLKDFRYVNFLNEREEDEIMMYFRFPKHFLRVYRDKDEMEELERLRDVIQYYREDDKIYLKKYTEIENENVECSTWIISSYILTREGGPVGVCALRLQQNASGTGSELIQKMCLDKIKMDESESESESESDET